jgi:RNA polymerase sigma-70 factor (ECF subfamily)
MDPSEEFEALTVRHLDSLHAYARLLARDGPAGKDLLQETLLRAFRAFGSYKRELSFKVWMFTIMRNVSLDWARGLRARLPAGGWRRGDGWFSGDGEDPTPSSLPLDPEQVLIRNVTVEQVREAIKNLPPGLREVVELREMEGLSYQSIAGVIGRPIGTVMSRLYRGRNLLRVLLREASSDTVISRRVHGL